MKPSVANVDVQHCDDRGIESKSDLVASEEPLEIRLKFMSSGQYSERKLAVTMRTPGNDFELATGFLFTEGIISGHGDVEKIFYCETVKSEEEEENVVVVVLKKGISLSPETFNRNFYINSSCGVCGKSSIESLQTFCRIEFKNGTPRVPVSLLKAIPNLARENQQVFRHTGGLHASALFDLSGKLIAIREDIGRHNALDKLIGMREAENSDNSNCILFVSGRAGFELVQKCIAASIPVMIAVGAPSSLAVELAREYGITLIGFAREDHFNIYSDRNRVVE